MPELESFDGVRLQYGVEGEGAPVVLLHGFGADTNLNWRQPGIVGALTAAGRRVIGLDARGHGRSEKPHEPSAYGNEAMVTDVGALFDHLGIDRADVTGYSMGAATALRFALTDRRLRRLALGGTDDPEGIEDPVAHHFRRLADSTPVVCGDADLSPHELAAALPAGHLSAVLEPAMAAAIVEFLRG